MPTAPLLDMATLFTVSFAVQKTPAPRSSRVSKTKRFRYGTPGDLLDDHHLYRHLGKIFVPYASPRHCPFPTAGQRKYKVAFVASKTSRARAMVAEEAPRLDPRDFAIFVPGGDGQDAHSVRENSGTVPQSGRLRLREAAS